jgi:hypothetical protein
VNIQRIIIGLISRPTIGVLVLCASVNYAQQYNYTYDASGKLVGVSTPGAAGPSITAQPQNQLVESNASITISVVRSGV